MKLISTTAILAVLISGAAIAGHHEGGKADHKSKMFEAADSNSDGLVSKSEYMNRAEEKFAEKDTNKDGSLSMDEAKAHHEARREEMKEKREKMKSIKESME